MGSTSWTIQALLKVSADYLKEKQIESPRLTAEVLLAHQLNINRVGIYLNFDKPLNEFEVSGYRTLIKRRVQREPLQYICGKQEFWSMDFNVDRRVLIPRPETELLVEQVLKRAGDRSAIGHPPRILDMGTGSGILAIVLAKEIPDAVIHATDISAEALDLARKNAEDHGVLTRIDFFLGNLWEPVINKGFFYDFIISNPPYVSEEEYDRLSPEVRDYEPRVALDGHKDGMHYIHEIVQGSPDALNPGGWLMMEMDPRQTDVALESIDHTGVFCEKRRVKDYGNLYRVVCARKGSF